MTDRWNPKRVTVQTEVQPKFFVPGERPLSSGAVQPRGKTWGIRVSGDVDKRAPQLYRCPVHGEFTREVPLSDVPDQVTCGVAMEPYLLEGFGHDACEASSPWAGAPVGIGHAAGEVMS